MKHKYLITGATGFVGSWLARAFVKNGDDVSIIARNKNLNWRLTDIADKLHIYQTDLQNPKLESIVDNIKPTVIFHLAAYGALPGQIASSKDLIDTNVNGLINLINAAKKQNIHLFINTGSSSEYGIKDKPMNERDTLQPINDYGVSKAAATLYAQKAAIIEGLPITTLRLFSPYGFYDEKKRLISYVIEKALKNEPISLSSKSNVRDFIYIEDVVSVYMRIVEKRPKPGEIINIGSGKQHSVYDIVKTVITLTKSTSSLSWGTMPQQARQVEPTIWQADITKAKKILQWRPKYSLEQGLEEMIKYYQKYI